MPRVSILCSVHNEEAYVEQFLGSLYEQKCEDWELLIVDDGSDDATADIVQSNSLRDNRIRFLARGEKIGKVSAYSLAFAKSRGDVIVLAAGDDILPVNSLSARAQVFDGMATAEPTVAYFKLAVIKEDGRPTGIVLPRGEDGSRSGGVLAMNRALANRLFPIPASLPSEDSWLTPGTSHLATNIVHSPEIVLNYRVHSENSNPRFSSFETMNRRMSERSKGIELLLSLKGEDLAPRSVRELEDKLELERLRERGDLLSVLSARGVPLIDRIATAALTTQSLWSLRRRLGIRLSGFRGR